MTNMTIERVVTIGVYGFTADTFFSALQTARVDTLVDIRWRRGVRGAAYAFANSQRLQMQLAALDIGYLHVRDLAPTPAVRAAQKEADKASSTAKRQRATLSPAFTEAFEAEILGPFDPAVLQDALPPDARTIALLCVEREPAACHRSLVANGLAAAWAVNVEHLVP